MCDAASCGAAAGVAGFGPRARRDSKRSKFDIRQTEDDVQSTAAAVLTEVLVLREHTLAKSAIFRNG